jgi:hypothetical protein
VLPPAGWGFFHSIVLRASRSGTSFATFNNRSTAHPAHQSNFAALTHPCEIHRIVPVLILSFLFALLQLLHFPGEQTGCEKGNSTVQISASAQHTWNRISPDRVLNWVAEVEDSEDSHNAAFGPIAFCTLFSEAYQPAPFIKQTTRRVQIYNARASIEEPPLFLIHRNFRV